MHRRSDTAPFLLALLALAAAFPVLAGEERIEDILDRMTAAVENLHYEGAFVYASGSRMETVEIVHGYVDGVRRERLLSLTGEQREIVRNDAELVCIWPESETVLKDPRRSRFGLPVSFAVGKASGYLGNHYALRLDERYRRVAGHDCREVVLMPEDLYRYGHRYCIEKETAMPLRVEVFDAQSGEVLELFMFTNIRFPAQIPAARFEPVMAGDGYRVLRLDKRAAREDAEGDMAWSFSSPPGFVLTRAVKRRMSAGREPVQHMVVTDGLASVSVFIARAGEDDTDSSLIAFGPMKTLVRRYDEWLITVVGEVPAATVLMVAGSIRYGE